MGESELVLTPSTEQELRTVAARIARCWRDGGHQPLLVGLCGELGSGKTTWVRSMLRGLGYRDRVPSPTYTLLERYAVDGLTLVHLDLYRLASHEELEYLAVRDWLARRDVWLLVEWPERAEQLQAHCDLRLSFEFLNQSSRRVTVTAESTAGRAALGSIDELVSNYYR